MRAEDEPPPTARPAWIVAAIALALYLALPQHSFWGDGRRMLLHVEDGQWAYRHLFFLPAAQLARLILEPLAGLDAERSVLVVMALTSAAGVGLVTRAASLLGARPLAAVGGGLLTALAPTVFFFATSIELHAPQVLSSGVILWSYGRWRRNETLPDVLVLAALLLLNMATHLSGGLWVFAFAWFALFGTGRFRLPRGLMLGLVLTVGGVFAWTIVNPEGASAPVLFAAAVGRLFAEPGFDRLWRELGEGSAFLLLAPVLLLRGGLARREVWLVFWTLAPAIALVQALDFEEKGAYFISVLPVLGLLSALGLDRIGARLRVPLLALLLVGQGACAHEFVREWQEDYRGAEWAEPLKREFGDRGLLYALENWEAHAVHRHSHLFGVSLRTFKKRRQVELDLSVPALRDSAVFLVERERAQGHRLAITRSLFEYAREDEGVAGFLELLEDRYGAPVPGDHEAYLVYPGP